MKYLKQVFVALLLLCSTALMAEEVKVAGITYEIKDDNTAIVVKGINSADIIIPATITYKGVECKVTAIGEKAFADCYKITNITIPESVTAIGNNAFVFCDAIEEFEIPNSVVSIGDFAFFGCECLQKVFIPKSVESIGKNPFARCTGIASIVIEEGNAFYDCGDNCNSIIETSTKTFVSGCANSKIPSGVVAIGDSAFYFCTSLTDIKIPNSVKHIGSYAFYNCHELGEINIPGNVTDIGDYAFFGCGSLVSVEIPDGVTDIGEYAFGDCFALKNVIIPGSVATIAHSMFFECGSLESVVISDGVTNIDNYAFSYTSIENVTLPNSVKRIGKGAFVCSGLKSLTIPNSVAIIDTDAFACCWSLKSVIIGSGVEQIGSSAFRSCNSLIEVYCFSSTVPLTDDTVFEDVSLGRKMLYVPAGSIDEYKATAPWSGFGDFKPLSEEMGVDVIMDNQLSVSSDDGVISLNCGFDCGNVEIYAMDGRLLAIAPIINGNATINTTLPEGTAVIVNVGNKRVKIVID